MLVPNIPPPFQSSHKMPRTQLHHITCWTHNIIIIITSNIHEYMSNIFTICPPLRIWLLLFHFVLWIFCAGRHSLLLPEMSGKLTGLIYLNWQLMRFYNVIISFVHTSSGPPLSFCGAALPSISTWLHHWLTAPVYLLSCWIIIILVFCVRFPAAAVGSHTKTFNL